jgi:DNA-binding NarL/FixJ family response regulator
MINVAIADDHPLIREGVNNVLNNEMDIHVISEASNGGDFISNIKSELPDVAILDMTMPGKSGLDLIKEVKDRFPDLPILVLSIHPPERYALRALKSGAMGYLNKSSITQNLVTAVRRIADKHKKYITPDVTEVLADNIGSQNEEPLYEKLSDREFEVLCKIAKGKSVLKIAEELSLSPNTIQTYRTRIKEKMHLKSNVEMTHYALEHDLIK